MYCPICKEETETIKHGIIMVTNKKDRKSPLKFQRRQCLECGRHMKAEQLS